MKSAQVMWFDTQPLIWKIKGRTNVFDGKYVGNHWCVGAVCCIPWAQESRTLKGFSTLGGFFLLCKCFKIQHYSCVDCLRSCPPHFVRVLEALSYIKKYWRCGGFKINFVCVRVCVSTWKHSKSIHLNHPNHFRSHFQMLEGGPEFH